MYMQTQQNKIHIHHMFLLIPFSICFLPIKYLVSTMHVTFQQLVEKQCIIDIQQCSVSIEQSFISFQQCFSIEQTYIGLNKLHLLSTKYYDNQQFRG